MERADGVRCEVREVFCQSGPREQIGAGFPGGVGLRRSMCPELSSSQLRDGLSFSFEPSEPLRVAGDVQVPVPVQVEGVTADRGELVEEIDGAIHQRDHR